MTTLLPPSLSDYDERGSLFVKEFEFNDACEKVRHLPLVVINRPTKVIVPSRDCSLPALKYTEWSSSLQAFRFLPGEYGCLDHIISVRVAMSSNSVPTDVIDNVSTFLNMFESQPLPSIKFGTL